jgi:hypothetical protein
LVTPDPRGGELFPKPDLAGFLAGSEMMSGFAIGANNHFYFKGVTEFLFPDHECAGGCKFEVVVMSVDEK